MSSIIKIPKALFEGDYETWDFECPHCKSIFTHHKNDLGIKKCASCHKLYACDDIGQIIGIDKMQNCVFNGKDFVLEK